MKIAIRMDDITPDMDWEKFYRFKAICDKYQIKPLIGVVPEHHDELLHIDEEKENFWEYIKQLQKEGWEIAQHGVNHVYHTRKKGCFPLNALSEFAGIPYKEQKERLQAGKEILEGHGVFTDMFMAPAHSYDFNTLKALSELGFTKITDGFGKKPYKWKGLLFYPISFKQSSSLKKKDGYTTFVVHANTMNDKDFDRYERLLSEKHNDFISYHEYLQVTPVKKGCVGKVAEYLQAYLKYILVQKL